MQSQMHVARFSTLLWSWYWRTNLFQMHVYAQCTIYRPHKLCHHTVFYTIYDVNSLHHLMHMASKQLLPIVHDKIEFNVIQTIVTPGPNLGPVFYYATLWMLCGWLIQYIMKVQRPWNTWSRLYTYHVMDIVVCSDIKQQYYNNYTCKQSAYIIVEPQWLLNTMYNGYS